MRASIRSVGSDLAVSRGPALFAVGTFGANVANFLFHAVASRSLGPEDYGALTAFLVVATAVTVPLAAMQVSITRALLRGALGEEALDRSCARAALVVGGGWTVLSPLLALTLRVDTWVAALMGVYLAAAVLGLAPKAVLLATDRLGSLAGGGLLGASIRVGLGWALLESGGGLGAAIAAGALAETATTAVFFRMRRPLTFQTHGSPHAWEAHVTSVLAIGSIWTLLATDVFLARMFMEATAAGLYAGTALIARSTLFVPQALTAAMFPRLVGDRGRPESVALTHVLVIGSSVAGIVFVLAATPLVSAVLLGGYPIDRGRLALLCGEMACLALANLKVHEGIAAGRTRVAGPWLIVVIATCAAALTATDPRHLALVSLAAAVLYLLSVTASRPVRKGRPVGPAEPPAQEIDVTAIVPIFNKAEHVVDHLQRLSAELEHQVDSFEILAVDDGSTDESSTVVAGANLKGVRVIARPHRGKGAAIREGMQLARGRYIGFIDADGDIPAYCFTRLLDHLAAHRADGAVGIRRVGSDDDRPLLRRIGSKLVARVVTTTLTLEVADPQAGAKVFSRSIVMDILPLCLEDGFAFDGEFLAFGTHVIGARFIGVPVEVTAHSHSTVRMRDAARVIRATFRIGRAIDRALRSRQHVRTSPHPVLERGAA